MIYSSLPTDGLDINKTPTLPSLAFKIFRTHYLINNKIPLIKGKLYKILSQAYYGGHVDSEGVYS